jgi:F420H(2)-dependent quinone reductase
MRAAPLRDSTVKRLSALHAALFRFTRGRLGRRLVDNDMLLLTTMGCRTGQPHTVPLLYLHDNDRLVVVASYGGRPDHPQWFKNLEVNPEVTVQIEGARIPAKASVVTGPDRDRLWPRVLDAYDGYGAYQSKTDRVIPLVYLELV